MLDDEHLRNDLLRHHDGQLRFSLCGRRAPAVAGAVPGHERHDGRWWVDDAAGGEGVEEGEHFEGVGEEFGGEGGGWDTRVGGGGEVGVDEGAEAGVEIVYTVGVGADVGTDIGGL